MNTQNFKFKITDATRQTERPIHLKESTAENSPSQSNWTPATKFAKDVFDYYVNGQTNFVPKVVDAITRTKFDLISSGLIEAFDGKIRWKSEDQPEPSPIQSRVGRFKPAAACLDAAAGWIPSRRKEPHSKDKQTSLPNFKELVIDSVVTPVKRDLRVSSHIDNNGRAGVEIRGREPFLAGSRWMLQGSMKMASLGLRGNEGEVSLTRPFLWRDRMDLGGIKYFRGSPRGPLAEFVSATNQNLSATYHNLEEHAQVSVGVEQNGQALKTRALESGVPSDWFGPGDRTSGVVSLHKEFEHTLGKRVGTNTHLSVDASVPIVSGGIDLPATLVRTMISHLVECNLHRHFSLRARLVGGLSGFPLIDVAGDNVSNLPAWTKAGDHRVGLTTVPLQKRFFAGGPANRLFSFPMRGFCLDSVGGMTAMAKPFSRSACRSVFGSRNYNSQTFKLGGLFAGGGSAEVVVRDFPTLLGHEREGSWANRVFHQHPLVKEILRPLEIVGFVDSGFVKGSIDESFDAEKALHVSAGVGLRIALDNHVKFDATFAVPLICPGSAQRAPFQIGISL